MEKEGGTYICSNGSNTGGDNASTELADGKVSAQNGVGSKSEVVSQMDPKMLKKWRVCQLVCLSVLVVIMWMLLLLPILFYHLPVDANVSRYFS